MSESTKIILVVVLLGCVLFFTGGFFANGEITGSHSVGVYYIEPFYENPETLDAGLGSHTPIIEFFPPLTGISEPHIKQSIVLSLFSLVSDTILREPVRFLSPLLFSLLGVFFVLRFASRERVSSETPKKILEYVSTHPGVSLTDIVKGINVPRGSVTYHLRKLLKERRLYKTVGEGHAKYAISKNDLDSLFTQTEKVKANPINDQILCYLLENPDTSRKDLAENLGLSVSVVYWHLIRLEKFSLVIRKKAGRSFVYRLSEEKR